MPTLGNALDLAKYEARNLRAHQLGAAPSSPVTGQLYYNTADNTLYWWDGSQWVSARGGAQSTPPATTSSLGTVQLAGDLAGTAASPQIAAGVITDAEVAAANKDGAAGTASMRTLGTGATQAAPGNDARFSAASPPTAHATTHQPGGADAMAVDAAAGTGSLRTLGLGAAQALPGSTPLNGVTPPAANLNMNGQKIISLLDPTGSSDAATKQYVDGIAQGIDTKASVRVASTTNLNLAAAGATIDGVTMVNLDRVLVKDQSAPAQNGIYVWNTGGVMSRAIDMDAWAEVPGSFVFVEQGTTQADTGWVSTADAGGTLGTTAMPWTQFSGAGQITAGAGMTKSGSTLDVGAGAGITVNADSVQVANNGITNAMLADGAVALGSADVSGTLPLSRGGTNMDASTPAGKNAARANLEAAGRYSSATHSAGTTISIPQTTHNCLAQRGLIVQAQIEATGEVVIPDIVVSIGGDVTVTFGVSQSANTIRVTIIG